VPVSPSIVRHEVSVRNQLEPITRNICADKQPATSETRRILNEFTRVRIVAGMEPRARHALPRGAARAVRAEETKPSGITAAHKLEHDGSRTTSTWDEIS
jgi:hypothetical protein